MSKDIFQKFTLFCIGVNILIIVVVFLAQKNLPPVVPLFYGLPVSQSELAKSILLIIPPIVSCVFIIFNLLIVKTTKDVFLQKVFVGLDVVTIALSGISVLKIIFLIGRM